MDIKRISIAFIFGLIINAVLGTMILPSFIVSYFVIGEMN